MFSLIGLILKALTNFNFENYLTYCKRSCLPGLPKCTI